MAKQKKSTMPKVKKKAANAKVAAKKPVARSASKKAAPKKKAASMKKVAPTKKAASMKKVAPKKTTPRRKPSAAPAPTVVSAPERTIPKSASAKAKQAQRPGQGSKPLVTGPRAVQEEGVALPHAATTEEINAPERDRARKRGFAQQAHSLAKPNELHPGQTAEHGRTNDRPGSQIERVRHLYPNGNKPNSGSARSTQAKGKRRDNMSQGG